MSSQLFNGKGKPTSGIQTVHFSDAPSIRRIQGTKFGDYMRELNFKRADGHLVGKDNFLKRVLNFMGADGQLEGRIRSQAGDAMAD